MANTVLIKMQCTRFNAGGGWSSHVCTLAHPQSWEKCESQPLGASLKSAKLTVLSANTLDIRRNCRHNHMLGLMRALFLLVAIASVSACSFYERQEYRITSVSRADVARVRHMLSEVATQSEIPKNVGGYHSDGEMIGWYNKGNVDLHATWHRAEINVELSRTDWPPPLAFRRADRLLTPALSSGFGRRFQRGPRPLLSGEASSERIITVY
jgi:hypothetical protein